MLSPYDIALRPSNAGWRDLWGNLAPQCGYPGCVHAHSVWRRMRRRLRGVALQGTRYCQTECLEMALVEILSPVPDRAEAAAHRIPLGLILLSRRQLTAAQLRTALQAQRDDAGASKDGKRFGAWLQQLGFVTERQVTAALACQWSCPVLRASTLVVAPSRFPAIPVLLLESFQMMPVELVESTRTLFMAFSESVDYTMLYAIEQMLGYQTAPCLVCPSILKKSLHALARSPGTGEVVFDRPQDARECAHIIASYSANVRAQEVRVARCGEHLWIRLESQRHQAVTLVLRAPLHSSQFSVKAETD
jgi:hypothetical protein